MKKHQSEFFIFCIVHEYTQVGLVYYLAFKYAEKENQDHLAGQTWFC